MKKILSLIIASLLLFTYVSANEAYGHWEKWGWFGENATYHYSSETGILTIEGTGEATQHRDYETGNGFTSAEYAEYISNSWRVREVVIGEGITSLDHNLFWFFRDLEKVTLPSTLEEIGYDVFYYCKSLKEITLPEGLKKIGASAFEESGITKINIPEGVTEIGYRAFKNCPLEELHLPSTLETIEYAALASNKHTLKKITVDEDSPYFTSVDGVLYTKDMTKLVYYPSGKKDKAFTLPETVKTVGENAFMYTLLSEINVNEGVEVIEGYAFSYSDTLEVLNLPSTLTQVSTFCYCPNIKKIVVPEKVTRFYSNNNELIDTVYLGDGMEYFYCYCGKFHHHNDSPLWDTYNYGYCQRLIDKGDVWAEKELAEAEKLGLITESASYGFKSRITRREFAEIVVNMTEKLLGEELPLAEENFLDTHSVAVSKAKAAGLVTGRGDNLYNPGSFITREEIAVMFLRAIEYIESEKGVSLIEKLDTIDKKYSDRDKVSSWAVSAMATLNKADIIKGSTNTTLFPSGTATVQESVLLSARIFEIVK